MTERSRPVYLTDLLFETIDRLIGDSDEAEVSVTDIRKQVSKSMRKLPWRRHADPAYREIRKSMRLFRPQNSSEVEYTQMEVLDHYRKKGWEVVFIPKKPGDINKKGSYFRFWK